MAAFGPVSYINGNYYTGGIPQMDTNNAFGQIAKQLNIQENMKPLTQERIDKYYTLIGSPSMGQAQPQGAGNGMMTGKLPDMYNRLTMQANDALYGGILGYQPKPITSPTGNQYQPPANQGFQFPFGLLNRNFLGQ
jgi:hypothetical protein